MIASLHLEVLSFEPFGTNVEVLLLEVNYEGPAIVLKLIALHNYPDLLDRDSPHSL